MDELYLIACLVKSALCSRKREAEAAAFSRDAGAFDPDAPIHSFYQLLTNVETQAGAMYGTRLMPCQAEEFAEEQGYVIRRNTWAIILNPDMYV